MLALWLIPIIVLLFWLFRHKLVRSKAPKHILPRDYFVGLQYLIDEQPDKAVDVFIKLLEVNRDTVETHLALGGLFRRRGEVNRAIRVHQNLIARPQLAKNQRIEALFELAQDYLHAGVLDRAEELFLELTKQPKKAIASFNKLLSIYEQQKEWHQAIATAKKLELTHKIKVQPRIAHYYCELGEVKKALQADRNCVRANLMKASELQDAGRYKSAIQLYQQVAELDIAYFSEIVAPLARCYAKLNQESEFISYLQKGLRKRRDVATVMALADSLNKQHDSTKAIEFVTKQLHLAPSLRGLECLIGLYLEGMDIAAQTKLKLLQEVIAALLREQNHYCCGECGFSSKMLYWQCPACKRWSSIKPRGVVS